MAGAPPPKMGTQRSARHLVRRPCPARRASRARRPRRLDRPVDPCPARCGVAGSGWGSAGSRSAASSATGSLLTEGVAGSVQACAPDRPRMGLPLAVAIARPNPPAATTWTRALATPFLTTPAPSKRSCRLTQPDAQIWRLLKSQPDVGRLQRRCLTLVRAANRIPAGSGISVTAASKVGLNITARDSQNTRTTSLLIVGAPPGWASCRASYGDDPANPAYIVRPRQMTN